MLQSDYGRLEEAPHPKYLSKWQPVVDMLQQVFYPDGLIQSTTGKPYVKEMTYVANKANRISEYMAQNWPQLQDVKGVWVVGSTAYMLADGREPKGDLDLICADDLVLTQVINLIASTKDALTKTYMGGDRVYSGGRQVDVWTLQHGQTIDDAIKGFSSTHPQARVAYEIATGKLIVYPNERV